MDHQEREVVPGGDETLHDLQQCAERIKEGERATWMAGRGKGEGLREGRREGMRGRSA